MSFHGEVTESYRILGLKRVLKIWPTPCVTKIQRPEGGLPTQATQLDWGTNGINVQVFCHPPPALLGQMLSLELPISKFLKSCGEKGKKVHVTASVFSKREMEIYKLTGVWASFSCKKPTRPSRRWMVVSSGATRKVYGKTGRLGDFGKSQT